MGSHKNSAKAKEREKFYQSLDSTDLDSLFASEKLHTEHAQKESELAQVHKACTSKNRYATRGEAEENLQWCADHGTRGLRIYKCKYCNGWHLTSKPQYE